MPAAGLSGDSASAPLAGCVPRGSVRRAPEVLASLAAGRVKIPIAARFPLMEAAGAHELLEQRKVTGKIILEV